MILPSHAESYNPPPEYLFTEDERKKWEETEPEERKTDYIPNKYDAFRKVPFYERFYRERFERCMDLYLAPRQIKMKLNVEMKTLLPDLPNPQDLQPFPTTLGFVGSVSTSFLYHRISSICAGTKAKLDHYLLNRSAASCWFLVAKMELFESGI